MHQKQNKPSFEKRIFWDVDYHNIDFDKKHKFVIERVFNRGDVEDIRQCRRYYGDDMVQKVLLDSKYIVDHRLHLVSAILNKPLNTFRCYTLKQSNPKLYPY